MSVDSTAAILIENAWCLVVDLIRLYRERLEDLIQKYRVDLVISAHLHSYERVCTLRCASWCLLSAATHHSIPPSRSLDLARVQAYPAHEFEEPKGSYLWYCRHWSCTCHKRVNSLAPT